MEFPLGSIQREREIKSQNVPGVKVGHRTLEREGIHTGVTVILPVEDNIFLNKCTAAAYVHNGFGKPAAFPRSRSWEPGDAIALTNTLNVGLVADALVEYTLKRCEADGAEASSVNPVVGECNDSRINRISLRAVKKEDVFSAIDQAGEEFEEGCVGAGAGTLCYGFKAESVPFPRGGCRRKRVYHRSSGTVQFWGNPFPDHRRQACGREILAAADGREDPARPFPSEQARTAVKNSMFRGTEEDRGSIMMICATDLPLSERQLRRLIRRMCNGLARTGSYTGHGSGEVMIGFTTAGRVPDGKEPAVLEHRCLNENLMDGPFQAVAEATEEAVLNSMTAAVTTKGLDGTVYYSLAEFLQ